MKDSPQKLYTFYSSEAQTVGDLMRLLAERFGTTGRIQTISKEKGIVFGKNTPILASDFTEKTQVTFLDDKITQKQIELDWADLPKGTMSFYPTDFSGKSFGDLLEAVRREWGAAGGKLQGITKGVVSDLDENQKIPQFYFVLNKVRYTGGTRVMREAPDQD